MLSVIETGTFHFFLNEDGTNTFECTLYTPSNPTESFYNEACIEDGNHLVSWGYNDQGFAVMTVRDKYVFFLPVFEAVGMMGCGCDGLS